MKPGLRILALIFLAANFPQLFAQTPSVSAPHATYAEKLHIDGVPNAGKINEHLYRGAQPQSIGLAELKKLGITTIVDLRSRSPRVDWEQRKAEALGIHFVHIPVNGWKPPKDEQVAQFLSIFRDSPQEKVFVHCLYGDDRTGMFVAAYRMTYDSFLADEALDEMYKFGFNGPWHPSMADFVRGFPARLASSTALTNFKKP